MNHNSLTWIKAIKGEIFLYYCSIFPVFSLAALWKSPKKLNTAGMFPAWQETPTGFSAQSEAWPCQAVRHPAVSLLDQAGLSFNIVQSISILYSIRKIESPGDVSAMSCIEMIFGWPFSRCQSLASPLRTMTAWRVSIGLSHLAIPMLNSVPFQNLPETYAWSGIPSGKLT